MRYTYDDGGRAAAGYRGATGDCFTRALAIAARCPYQWAYDYVRKVSKKSPRDGVSRKTSDRIMHDLGWTWVPTMRVGQGCKVHLRTGELPAGRLIVRVSKHWVAVINGEIRDNHDPSRESNRCVYGYWIEE